MEWITIWGAQQALLPFALRAGVSDSRRLLAATLILVVPGAGPLLALLVRRTRGAGAPIGRGSMGPPNVVYPTAEEMWLVGETPPLLDRVMSLDAEVRTAALSRIAATADRASMVLLHWAMDHGAPDVVLDVAMTIDDLDLRREQRLEIARRELVKAPSFERALAAASAAADAVVAGIADDTMAAALAADARDLYRQAFALAPTRWFEVDEGLARLELALGNAVESVDILDRVMVALGEREAQRLGALRADAAFAARRFEGVGPRQVLDVIETDPEPAWCEATMPDRAAHDLPDMRREPRAAAWNKAADQVEGRYHLMARKLRSSASSLLRATRSRAVRRHASIEEIS